MDDIDKMIRAALADIVATSPTAEAPPTEEDERAVDIARRLRRWPTIAAFAGAAAALVVAVVIVWTSDRPAGSTVVATTSTAVAQEPTTVAPESTPSSTSVPEAPIGAVSLADWAVSENAAGRTYVDVADQAGDASLLITWPYVGSDNVGGAVLRSGGDVVPLPLGVAEARRHLLVAFAGRLALVVDDGSQFLLWVLDDSSGTWVAGPDLGVAAEPSRSPFIAALGDQLVVAVQTVRDAGNSFYVPGEFEGVVVDGDLTVERMQPPPEGVFLDVTARSERHALLLGVDTGAGVNAPLTQPWDFDAAANVWSPIPAPSWLECASPCEWPAPHEFGDVTLVVEVDGGVVMRLPDGSIGRYAVGDQTWTRVDDAPFALQTPQTAVLGDLVVVVPVSIGIETGQPGVVGVLDLTTGKWEVSQIDLGVAAGTVIGPEIRVTGQRALVDFTSLNGETSSSPEAVYDAATRAWRDANGDDVTQWRSLAGRNESTSLTLDDFLAAHP